MKKTLIGLFMAMMCAPSFASEASLVVPNIKAESILSYNLLVIGIIVSVIGVIFGLIEYLRVKRVPVHAKMEEVGSTIFETCKTYLIQQGKFLLALEILIGLCIAFYFWYLQGMELKSVLIILGWSVLGILGSYLVAWFGIRMNTLANSRTAFKALEGDPLKILGIPLSAGMMPGTAEQK